MCRTPFLLALSAGLAFWSGLATHAQDGPHKLPTQPWQPDGGRNLYFNSGFELGDAGFGCNKFLRPDTNPELRDEKPRIDRTTFVSGKQSLRIPNRFVEETMFYGREVKWELGQQYTFSAWMKTSAEKLPVHVWLCTKTWGGAHGGFTVGPEWQRYSFTFKAPTDRRGEYCHMSVWFAQKDKADAEPADLWLDDLQLIPGDEPGAYAPGHQLELSAEAPKINYLSDGSALLDVQCLAINNGDQTFSGTMTLAVIDDYTKEQVAGPTFEISLPPHEPQVVSCPVRIHKYGSYRLEPRLPEPADFAANPAYSAVIGRYERKPLDLDRDFCVGINLAGGGTSDARIRPGWQTLGGGAREEYIKLLAQMGCRIIRDHDTCGKAFDWRVVEPEEGHFDFQWADRTVDLYLKYGIQPLPVLQGAYTIKNEPHHQPFEWLQQRGETIPKYLDCNHTGVKGSVVLGPEDLWRRYVRAVAERYRGRITHYEIFNEPNLYISPENYMRYLKSASEELRAADPQCKVVGFCSTGDLAGEGKSAEYLKPCFDLGGLDCADIVSFHPYDSRQLSSRRPADQMIATYQALVTSYQRDNPLWNTELYYLSDGKSDDPNVYDAPKRFLIDLGEGVRQSTCVSGYGPIFKTLLLENTMANSNRHAIECLPAPTYVIYNALARLFERARPVDKIHWPLDTICYVYERDDGPRAAFWTYGSIPGVRIRLPEARQGIELRDMFGNAVPLDGQAIPLGTDPYYVVAARTQTGTSLAPGELVDWLRRARLETEKDVIADLRQLLATAQETTAYVDLRNCQPDKQVGQVRIQAENGEFGPATDFSIPEFSLLTLPLPLPFSPENGDKPLVAEIRIGDQTLTQKTTRRLPFVYDAKPGLGAVESCRKKGRGWNLEPEIATTFQAGYDAENLILHIVVKDRTPSGEPQGRNPWEQDALELFFDPRPDLLDGTLAEAQRYHGKVGRVFVSPYEAPGKQLTFMPGELSDLNKDTVRCTISTSADGYAVELTIRREALELSGPIGKRCLGFELAVDDAVGRETAAFQQTWNSWGAHFRDRLSFGLIRFTE